MDAIYDFHNHTPRFDLEAEVLCLNFANTLDWHASQEPEEELNTYADLVAWGYEAEMLSAAEANRLVDLGNVQPEQAQTALKDAITLREAIYRIFVAFAHEYPVDAGDLTVLTQFWRMASQQLRLTVHADELSWEYEQNEADLRRILWPVVQSAVELLQSDQRHRVGQCQDDRGCGFLFQKPGFVFQTRFL
jgi:predicted RNA-binding Zn ribbon-like protein